MTFERWPEGSKGAEYYRYPVEHVLLSEAERLYPWCFSK